MVPAQLLGQVREGLRHSELGGCCCRKTGFSEHRHRDIINLGTPNGIAEVSVGDRVSKSGRTSGTNHGEVKVVQATIKISMGDTGDAVFSDQVVTTHMAEPGDSGSVVLNSKGQVVGLLSAGSDTVSIFARIQNVLDALKIRF